MQTESHSDCPTSQAKRWKTFTCKYEWPTGYCEHASYGILNAHQPQKTGLRGLANQQLYCKHTQALGLDVMCVGYQLFCFCGLLVCKRYCYSPLHQAKLMLMNSGQDIMYSINIFGEKKLKSFLSFPHKSSVYKLSAILPESTHRWQQR